MITTTNGIANALLNNSTDVVINKANLASAVAGQMFSLFRAATLPAQAALPTTPALCTKALLGSFQFPDQVAPATTYIGWAALLSANSSTTIEIHDRIVHNGSLVLNVTTAQNITGLDLATLNPSSARLGSANYSSGEWYLDVYADGGATASNATINVTYNDDFSENLTAVAVGGTIRNGRKICLTPLIPAASAAVGRFIKRINSLTLSASTGTAGNVGFSFTRKKTILPLLLSNKTELFDWANTGAQLENDACIELVVICGSTSTGTLVGQIKLAHG